MPSFCHPVFFSLLLGWAGVAIAAAPTCAPRYRPGWAIEAPAPEDQFVKFFAKAGPTSYFNATFWRHSCDENTSYLLIRLAYPASSFVPLDWSSFEIVQNGIKYPVRLTIEYGSRIEWDGDAPVPITFFLEQRPNVPQYDPRQAVTLLYHPYIGSGMVTTGLTPRGVGEVPAGNPIADAVEYYHAGFDHYFMTAAVAEQALLDTGTAIQGWVRTGHSFKVRALPTVNTEQPVCRFFSASFAPKSSHFYTPFPSECDYVRTLGPWQFEGVAFYAALSAPDGTCQSGQKVYRLYNNGQAGAPNHRYTTSLEVRAQMQAAGWVPEGLGADGVQFCTAPLP